MPLPTEKSPAQARMGKVFLYAEPKKGKSTLAATLDPDRTILLDVEDGLGAIEGFKHRITNWGDVAGYEGEGRQRVPVFAEDSFRGTVKMLYDQRADHPFKVGVVDTADALSGLCSEYVLYSLGAGADRQGEFVHASDFDYGKGWSAITAEWMLRIGALCRVLDSVILISHADRTTKTDRIGAEYPVYTPSLGPKGLRNWTLGFVDHILFLDVERNDEDEDVVCVHTRQARGWEAGGRTVAGGASLPDPIWLPDALTSGRVLREALEKVSAPPEPKAALKAKAKAGAKKPPPETAQPELGEAA
jgi:hypothetical protein